MENNKIFAEITKNASKTFYSASLLFPKKIREDVFILYSFVRIADDLIDSNPPKIKEFEEYRLRAKKAFEGKKVDSIFIETFADLAQRKNIPYSLINDFFVAQRTDATKKNYKSYEELLKFVYGVAEVIGLLMAHVMDLPKKSYPSARILGRAMQLVNILRDIEEDSRLGRVYIPQDELQSFNIPNTITFDIAEKKTRQFNSLIQYQCERIFQLLDEAKKGFHFIPKPLRLPIQISTDLYINTTKKIYDKPSVIFEKKVKPSKINIFTSILINYLSSIYK